jgi:hypothetical protein
MCGIGARRLNDDFALEKLSAARQAIVEARTIPEAKQLLDKFTALADYAKRQRLELEVQNEIAECRIWTRRKIGVLLEVMPKAKGRGDRGDDGQFHQRFQAGTAGEIPTLDDLGISKAESSRLQSEAQIASDTVENYFEKVKEDSTEITAAGLRRFARDRNTMDVMGSSESPEWYTPQHIIDLTLDLFDGIDLDPCSNSHKVPNVPARIHYTKEDNGLVQTWHGKVYMNPPYGDEISDWTEKLVESYEQGEIEEAIALLPGRIDTQWFQPLYEYLICNIRGRLRFVGSENSAPFPSVIVYLGEREREFINIFRELGPILRRVDGEAAISGNREVQER